MVPQQLRVAMEKQCKRLGGETGTACETPKPNNACVGRDSSPQASHGEGNILSPNCKGPETSNGRSLTDVESRDASVISRFPFRPTRGGTNVSRSLTSLNTGQCWKRREEEMRPKCWHRSADVCREPSGNDLARPVNQPGRLRSVLSASFYFETGSLYIAQGTLELTL